MGEARVDNFFLERAYFIWKFSTWKISHEYTLFFPVMHR